MDINKIMEGESLEKYEDLKGFYNFSRIKDFEKLGLFKYHRKHILGVEEEDKDSAAMAVGSAVDCLLFEGEEVFDQKFFIGDNQKIPSGKGGEFARALHRAIKSNISFDLAFRRAYEEAEMSERLFNNFLEKFEGSEVQLYFSSLVESEGKTTISTGDLAAAHGIINTLQHHSRTRFLFDMDGYSQLEVLFTYNGYPMKCKIDKLIVDSKNKTLRPFDLKVFYEVDDFEYRYLKDLYFLQEAVYTIAVQCFRDKHYPGWKIDDFKFCVSHGANLKLPIIWNLKVEEGAGDLYEGFTTKSGRRYKGLDERLFEMKWHEDNDIWNTTYDVHNNKGHLKRIL